MGTRRMPLARKKDLFVEELPDEVLVYDLVNDKAHCLNRTSACVWKHCDGKRTAADIARLLGKEMGAPVDERLVQLALEQLGRRRLLDEPFKMPVVIPGMDRRRAVRTIGLGALVAVPLITSIVAPTPAHAQSGCLPNGSACTFDSDCCSGNCELNVASVICL